MQLRRPRRRSMPAVRPPRRHDRPERRFGFSDTEGTATFEVRSTGGGFVSASTPQPTQLSDGSHTLGPRPGPTGTRPGPRRPHVDSATPWRRRPRASTPARPPPARCGPNVSFGFSDTEAPRSSVQARRGAFSGSASPKAHTNLADGSHTFAVRALDAYGNTSAPVSRTWTVDAVAPPLPSIDSGPAAASTSSKNVSFGFSDTEGTATFEVQIDGGAFSGSASPKAYTNLADGSTPSPSVRWTHTATRARRSRAPGRWTRSRRRSRASTAAPPRPALPARTSASASPTRRPPRRSKSRSTVAHSAAPRARRRTRASPTAPTPSPSVRWTHTGTRARRSPAPGRWTRSAAGAEHRLRPRGRLDERSKRQLRLLRHGRHRDLRSPDRRRRLHCRVEPAAVRRLDRRLAYLRRPREGRLRQHVVRDEPHLDGRRHRTPDAEH